MRLIEDRSMTPMSLVLNFCRHTLDLMGRLAHAQTLVSRRMVDKTAQIRARRGEVGM